MQEFIYYFWIFVFGSILGVVIETIWCYIRYKKIESRKGLIFGPFNPLYGVATLVLSYAINNFGSQSFGSIFLLGTVLASIIEYLCSYYQEKIVGTISWDYKNFKYNLNGRINLIYSLMWGILTYVWYSVFMPVIDEIVPFFYSIPKVTFFFAIFLGVDSIISLAACVRRKNRRNNIYAKTKLEKHLDYFYNDELLDQIYPNSQFTDKTNKS